jgi:hypothetical protein
VLDEVVVVARVAQGGEDPGPVDHALADVGEGELLARVRGAVGGGAEAVRVPLDVLHVEGDEAVLVAADVVVGALAGGFDPADVELELDQPGVGLLEQDVVDRLAAASVNSTSWLWKKKYLKPLRRASAPHSLKAWAISL